MVPLHNYAVINVTSFCHLELSSVIVYSTKEIHFKQDLIAYTWDPTLKFDVSDYRSLTLNLTKAQNIDDLNENIDVWFYQSHYFDSLWVLLGIFITISMIFVFCVCKKKICVRHQPVQPPPQNMYDMFAAPLVANQNKRN